MNTSTTRPFPLTGNQSRATVCGTPEPHTLTQTLTHCIAASTTVQLARNGDGQTYRFRVGQEAVAHGTLVHVVDNRRIRRRLQQRDQQRHTGTATATSRGAAMDWPKEAGCSQRRFMQGGGDQDMGVSTRTPTYTIMMTVTMAPARASHHNIVRRCSRCILAGNATNCEASGTQRRRDGDTRSQPFSVAEIPVYGGMRGSGHRQRPHRASSSHSGNRVLKRRRSGAAGTNVHLREGRTCANGRVSVMCF